MKTKRFFLFALTAVLVALLAACQMPASTPAPGAGTPAEEGDGFPLPDQTLDPMEELAIAATQTAMAQQGNGEAQEPTPEPAPPTDEAAQEPQPEQPETQPEQPETQPEQPAAQDQVPEPSPTAGVPNNYTLQRGEHPFCIARRYNVNQSELLALNGLTLNSVTYPGQTLRMPQTGNAFFGDRALRSHPTTYNVQGNDTIYTIACYFGDVDPLYLAAVNDLRSPYELRAGQTLQIP